MKFKSTLGFTLLEMSVVLVVVGVLTGGVLVGKSMVSNAKLRNVITDANNYITATANFKQVYGALPGDLKTASTYWTGAANGNGNGQIFNITASSLFEQAAYWKHLNLAGMFSKTLSGTTDAATAGVNVPSGPIAGSAFSVKWFGTISSTYPPSNSSKHFYFPDASGYSKFYGNILVFGRATNGAANASLEDEHFYANLGDEEDSSGFSLDVVSSAIAGLPSVACTGSAPDVDYSCVASNDTSIIQGGVLTPSQAQAIDSKIDDGLPGSGKLLAPNTGLSPSCTTVNSVYGYGYASFSVYNVVYTKPACSLYFQISN